MEQTLIRERKYNGRYVALKDFDDHVVIADGNDPKEVYELAVKKGYPDPVILSSPATFTLSVVEHTAYDPHILLVISEDCYDALGGEDVTISWKWNAYCPPSAIKEEDWEHIKNGWVPPIGAGFGKIYQAKSLRDHLFGMVEEDIPEDEGIYYTYIPLGDSCIPVTSIEKGEEYEFTVTVPGSPRCLVYAFGSNSKVPPTRPGFIIPEYTLGTVMAVVAMMAALMLRGKVSYIKR